MNRKRAIVLLVEAILAILFLVIFYFLLISFLGFAHPIIYSDKMTFWVTSLPPIGALVVLGIATYYLHKKQKKLAEH